MANAVSELIVLELISRLEEITTGNGYDMTARVQRVNRDAATWSPQNYDVVVVQGDETRNTDLDCPGNPPAIGYDLPISIMGFVRQSDRSVTADQQLVNNFVAAIRKAITATGSDWFTFDGNAINADVGNSSHFRSEDGSHAGATIELSIEYRVSETNPFQVR